MTICNPSSNLDQAAQNDLAGGQRVVFNLFKTLFGGGAPRPRSAPAASAALEDPAGHDDRINLATSRSYGVRVVGASHHQDAIRRFWGRGEQDATLVQEPDNACDPNAIRVEIDGVLVGHLRRESAEWFTNWIHARKYEGRRFKAPALIEHVIFDDGEADLLMVGLRILFNPPQVVGDLDTRSKRSVDLVLRQVGIRCVTHMEREKREPGDVTLGHAVDAGLLMREPCELCGKSGFGLAVQGYVAKFGHDRSFVEAHPETQPVSGWDM